MKGTYYPINEKKFHQLAKSLYIHKPAWKILNLLSWFFLLIGVVPIVVMSIEAAQPTVPTTEAAVLIVVVGFVLAFLLLCIAFVIKNQAIRCMGKPYTSMGHMFLYSNYSGFQFGHRDLYHAKWPENMMVDQIAYENIHHVEVNQALQLFTVVGRTERVEYINMEEDRIAYEFTNGQFGDMASFSFFLAIENKQDFFDELKKHNVVIQFT